MSDLDASLLLRAAKLANVAYTTDPKQLADQVNALGYTFLGLVTNGTSASDQGDRQAVVCKDADGRNVTANRGTQIEDHFSIRELYDDTDTTWVRLAGQSSVFAGFDDSSIIHEVMRMLNPSAPWDRIGHSKGGCEAETGRRWVSPDFDMRVFSFGAPACADAAFWTYAYGPELKGLYRVIAWDDFAPGWDLDSGGVQPSAPAVLVKPGQPAAWYSGPPVYETMMEGGITYHSITGSYIADLEAVQVAA